MIKNPTQISKKKSLTLSVCVLLVLVAVVVMLLPTGMPTANAAGGTWGGDGTQTNPYTIEDAADLAQLATEVNSGISHAGDYFQLTSDISLSAYSNWTPIGNSNTSSFNGNFDGNNKTIQDLTISSGTTYIGLFGYVGATGEINNLCVEDANIQCNGTDVGGVVGYNNGTLIECSSTSTSVAPTINVGGNTNIGGVVGYNAANGTLINCMNSSTVHATSAAGGVAGRNDQGTLINCTNSGDITANSVVGGVVGNNSGPIYNCSNTGQIHYNGAGTHGDIAATGTVNIHSGSFSLTGKVTDSYGNGLQGVVITCTGGMSGTTSTSSNGTYTIMPATAGGTVTITGLSRSGYISDDSNSLPLPIQIGANKVQDFTMNALVSGVELDETSLLLIMGVDTFQLTATVSPSNAFDKDVTWSTSDGSVAAVNNGLVTTVGPGDATITVTTDDGGFTATCDVTVTHPTPTNVYVTGVWLSQKTLALTVGESDKLAATISPSNATNKTVSWSSSDTSVATVDSNGVVKGVAAGTAVITVKTVDGGFKDTCDVTVTASFNVSLPTGNGYTTSPTGGPFNVKAGESFSFTISVDRASDASKLVVKANGILLTPDENGVYTISNIAENETVTVGGLDNGSNNNNLIIAAVVIVVFAALVLGLAYHFHFAKKK